MVRLPFSRQAIAAPLLMTTAASPLNTLWKTPLRFFQDTIPEPFKNDSNTDIDHVFIVLVYPHILIWDGPGQLTVDCRQDGFSAEPDRYPLLALLKPNGSRLVSWLA